MSEQNQHTDLWEDYRRGIAYQIKLGLRTLLPRCVRFYQGDQWAKATEEGAALPRPVVNVVRKTCDAKKSAILATPVRMAYRADVQDGAMVKSFNDFSDYIQKEYGQGELDREAMQDGVTEGTYVYHYYWDTEAVGLDGYIRGGMRCEVMDPLDVFFADPTKLDEQKQEWILLVTRENVRSLKAKIKKKAVRELIVPDSYDENAHDVKEQDGDELVTVLTRYFRRDGEVYCERATKTTVINEPFPIAPRVKEIEKEISAALGEDEAKGLDGGQVDATDNSLADPSVEPDAASESGPAGLRKYEVRAPLYPIVVGQYIKRKKCIYGIGEAELLLSNQRCINNNLAMMLYNVQQTAWGRTVVLPDALKGQEITNEPGEVITDHTGTGNGIRNLPPAQMASFPLTLNDKVVEMTRDASGANEVMTGEVVSSSMSGAAIAQLQGQAMVPISDLRNGFWEIKKKQGKVLAQFFKLFYHGSPYVRRIEDDEAQMPQYVQAVFEGDDYRDFHFDIIVETIGGSRFTNAGDITALDALYAKGEITAKEYIDAYPDDALSCKQKILDILQKKAGEGEAMAQLQSQLQQATEQLQRMAAYIEQNQKAMGGVDDVMRENQRLKEMLAALYRESEQKITEANAAIEASNAQLIRDAEKINELQSDAGEFARVIAGAMAQGAPMAGGGENAMQQM